MQRGGIICVIMLLLVGFVITPAMGSINFEAGEKPNYEPLTDGETVTVHFYDISKKPIEKKVVEFTETEWNNFKEELREIRTTRDSIEENFNAQFVVFKDYGLIEYDMTYQELEEKANEAFKDKNPRIPKQPKDTNIILNAMCAINFELDNGTTWVFGLNTFVNLIGFDIFSFHNGHSPDGIGTIGVVGNQQSAPGNYIGFMFGFLGYWAGTKTATGKYSDLVCAGFTITTAWVPLP